MAIDKNKTKGLIDEVNDLFDSVTGGLSEDTRRWFRDKLIGSALGEIEELVSSARPPVFYLVGRSGHGKSSSLNALAGRQVAQPGDVRPTTLESELYTIPFEDSFATWRAIDSRGIFETTSPHGGPRADVVELLKKDIVEKKPDLILHVIAAKEVRNLANDFAAYREIGRALETSLGIVPPTLIVITNVDALGNPREWPPEHSPRKLGLIDESLRYLVNDVLAIDPTPLDLNAPYKGVALAGKVHIGVVPVCTLENDLWNIETLRYFVGEHLPKSAILDFFQATRRKEQLRRLSQSITRRFASIAFGIGLSPVPVTDIIILSPLQLLLTAFIGGLSCRSFSRQTAMEFFTAAGLEIPVGIGLRLLAQQLTKLVPLVGSLVSGAIAASGTYAIGKAAEVYFFTGEVVPSLRVKSSRRRNLATNGKRRADKDAV